MGNLDFYIQSWILGFFLPAVPLFLLLRWYFDLRPLRFRTWVESKLLKFVHGKMEYEKKVLFGQLNQMKFGNCLEKNRTKRPLQVLEIGVGSGRNFCFYPENAVVTCLDPNPYQENYVKECLKLANKRLKLKKFVQAFAERMTGVESNQFDAVICTLTLCTVRKPEAVLEEIIRVLKPGGKFFFMEHVAGSRNSLTRWIQNRLQRIWSYSSGGCQLNRETWTYFDQSDFSEVNYQHFNARVWFTFVRPWMYGVAVK